MRDGIRANKVFFKLMLMAGMTVFPVPAFAGFEWTAPPPSAMQSATPDGPDVAAAPLMPVMESEMTMPPVEGAEEVVFDTPSMTPVEAADKHIDTLALAEPSKMPPVQGFGRDIALAMALRQIVPAQYAYSFDPGISPGMLVSWQGGKPWDIVLDDALAPQGLAAHVVDTTVWIKHRDASAMSPHMNDTAVSDDMTVMPPISMEDPQPLQPAPAMNQMAMEKPTLDEKALAEIGRRDDNYHPSYPRRAPDADESWGWGMGEPRSAPVMDEDMPDRRSDVIPGGGVGLPTSLTDIMKKPQSVEPAAGNAPEDLTRKTATAVAPLDPYEINFWQADAGESLQNVLGKWSDKAGVQLVWSIHQDYALQTPIAMHGTFPDAVTTLLTAYNDVKPRPTGSLHPNLPTGPSVLVVEESR